MLEDYIGERVYLELCGLHTHRHRSRPAFSSVYLVNVSV
jgi:hypothetical protein